MHINGKTKITGLFGYPVEHTLSPAMHNAAFEGLRLDYCYLPFLVRPDALKQAVDAVRALNMAGVNVTVPHKEAVISLLDGVDEEAAFIGAVNTIVNNEGTLKGYNTDGRGFMRSLSEAGISVENKQVLVVGAGGASRAISYYLSEKAKVLFLHDIAQDKMNNLVSDLLKIRSNVSPYGKMTELGSFDIIVNATPLGLKEGDPFPFDVSALPPGRTVCDLIYGKTRLIEEAGNKGCRTLDGMGMLLWQGVLAFELWTSAFPPVDIMRNALLKGSGQ